jgi:serine/threonine protein kinase/beta-lactam-binding protein with PASTA domain
MSHMTEHIGRVVGGRYRLLAPLGSGASAEVYLADDVRLRRRVAVKLLHAVLADDENFLRRFRAEARAAAALNHPNIVAVYDWQGDEAPPYLVTEYLGGGSLRSMLDAGHRLSPSQALVVGLQSAQALDHAHRQGFVHRDVKPANLVFGSEARLRIADFGLARAIAEAGWTEPNGAVLGTARYASPEQVRGEPLDGRSDLYSLALVLIEAVTGQVPFTSDTTVGTLMARLDRAVEVPEQLEALVPVLERVGQPDRNQRPDAATLVNDLVDAATLLPRPTPLTLVGPSPASREDVDPQDRTMLGSTASGSAPPPPAPPMPGSLPPPGAANDQDHTAVFTAPLSGPPGPPLSPVSGELRPVSRWRDPELRRRLVPFLAVLVALTAGVVGAWAFMELRVPSHEVPQQLIGAEKGEISDLVGDYGWRTDIEEVYRDDTEVGVVLETDPGPGSELREGETLVVTVSLGPSLVAVPTDDQLAGTTQEQADSILRGSGLELQPEFVPTPSDDVDEGLVIGLEEGTPERVAKGSTVRVLVSSGSERRRIPDVEGSNWEDAEEELEELGFEVEVRGEESDDVDEGDVIRTRPRTGRRADSGSTVILVVSTGDEPLEVPEIIGERLSKAVELLEEAGLEAGNVTGSDDDEARVWGATPFPGTPVAPGQEVDLWTL